MTVGSQAGCKDKRRKESRGIKCHSSKQKRYFWIVRFDTINPRRHTIVMCKRTVNRVELVGWVGADPEQRFIPSGVAVCTFRVATNRFAGWNEAGERLVEADWTTVEAWDRLTEQCGRFLHTGSRVRVIGSLQTQSWDDRESGQKRYKTVVRAEDVLFLDARQAPEGEAETGEQAVEDLPF